MSRLDNYEPLQAESVLIFVETLRQGKSLGKSNSFYPDDILEAKRLFKEWWNQQEKWEQKIKQDPLYGSNLEIRGL